MEYEHGAVKEEWRRAQKDYPIGKAEAQHDLADGRLAYETYGLPAPYFDEIVQLFRERYEVELRLTGGCVVIAQISEHARGYNEIMKPEIERRFGTNVWARTEADAEALYKTKNQPRENRRQ